MKSNGSDRSNNRSWVPPTVTKLAIGTQTKSPVDQTRVLERDSSSTNSALEPQPPSAPTMKFGFSLEWSFPLSVRTE